ncbi:conserved hypothetical protein [Leishmania mexicana MHOM/GT/2001/U1103]|uniref:Uncharacterized protein n=1 Tax=Leishmania mexicana (strain MHOM/GT/2001/U1103) TaxID=929439 RepID=E9AZ53_LEIMU|nr:conserved hypothetical protein [Leishmania mexicana MHOM/GT/2001/U1103]CBZ28250.1 conserved hypothetical protein [Leishmania mexicana MHOM/GT/2001/U1103]
MSDVNWALEENGAHIAEVSHEAVHVASIAPNLLKLREDQLWITGDAPQHVTVSLSPSHPPLQYAGWHVWHGYLTNPHMVEIASGASPDTMSTLLMCQALPGAGTQVWKLPRAIPQDHQYVRFRIMSTFGPGPTYMNTLVLLENDPGPSYSAYGQLVQDSATAADDILHGESAARHPSAAAASPYISLPTSVLRPPGSGGGVDRSPLPRRVPPTSLLPGASPISTANPRDDRSADVGVFIAPGPSASAHRGERANGGAGDRSPGGARSSSRMGQLLRDLDEDIKMLKPIKMASPREKMLLCVPQASHVKSVDSGSEDDGFAARQDGGNREGSANGKAHHTGENESSEHRRHHRHSRRSSSRRRNCSRREEHSRNNRSEQLEGSNVSQSVPMGAKQMALAVWPPPAVPSSAVELSSLHGERLSALEQAVAVLREAVQHQRDDLSLIKRVLLQQATERRKEAEQRCEEKQKMGTVAVALPVALAAPPAASSPAVAADTKTPVLQIAAPDQRLTHRSITVGFPEDALRAYVESVLDHKLRKQMKKVEAKLLQRLDKQLHDVIKVLSVTIEGRLAGLAPSSATAQQQAAPSHRPFSAGRAMPTQAGGLPTASSSTVRHVPRSFADMGGGARIDLGDAASPPSSSKGCYYHTPVTRTDSSARGPVGGSAAAATAAFPVSYVAMCNSPNAYRATTGAPPVSIAKGRFF